MIARRVLVSGRVQGVGFRWSCVQESRRLAADGLAVTGWIRNLPDGRVEAQVQGESDAVEALVGWLHQGPRSARVESLEQRDSALEPDATGFQQR